MRINLNINGCGVVSLLLERGAQIDAVNLEGWSALMLGARFGGAHTVRVLLERRADATLALPDGQKALDLDPPPGSSGRRTCCGAGT